MRSGRKTTPDLWSGGSHCCGTSGSASAPGNQRFVPGCRRDWPCSAARRTRSARCDPRGWPVTDITDKTNTELHQEVVEQDEIAATVDKALEKPKQPKQAD